MAAILAQGAEGKPIRVVDDQRGRPTRAYDLARGLVTLVEGGAHGLYHLAGGGEVLFPAAIGSGVCFVGSCLLIGGLPFRRSSPHS